MVNNRLFFFLILTIFCNTQSNLIYAHASANTGNALIAIRKTVGEIMVAGGGALLLCSIVAALKAPYSDPSIRILDQLIMYTSLCIGIPTTALGLLIILPPENSTE